MNAERFDSSKPSSTAVSRRLHRIVEQFSIASVYFSNNQAYLLNNVISYLRQLFVFRHDNIFIYLSKSLIIELFKVVDKDSSDFFLFAKLICQQDFIDSQVYFHNFKILSNSKPFDLSFSSLTERKIAFDYLKAIRKYKRQSNPLIKEDMSADDFSKFILELVQKAASDVLVNLYTDSNDLLQLFNHYREHPIKEDFLTVPSFLPDQFRVIYYEFASVCDFKRLVEEIESFSSFINDSLDVIKAFVFMPLRKVYMLPKQYADLLGSSVPDVLTVASGLRDRMLNYTIRHFVPNIYVSFKNYAVSVRENSVEFALSVANFSRVQVINVIRYFLTLTNKIYADEHKIEGQAIFQIVDTEKECRFLLNKNCLSAENIFTTITALTAFMSNFSKDLTCYSLQSTNDKFSQMRARYVEMMKGMFGGN